MAVLAAPVVLSPSAPEPVAVLSLLSQRLIQVCAFTVSESANETSATATSTNAGSRGRRLIEFLGSIFKLFMIWFPAFVSAFGLVVMAGYLWPFTGVQS